MTPLVWLLSVWGALTAVLVVLLIYRGTLTMHEDEQLFLSETESQAEKEQIEIMRKVDKLSPFVRWLGGASGLLALLITGLLIYQRLGQQQ
ncbi:MAG TPA: hypothetical protein VH088_15165 [Terriglobales bacterium]|jgi:hypothetical protein|nr:hypothetical protein [Terriglobales bacterium]